MAVVDGGGLCVHSGGSLSDDATAAVLAEVARLARRLDPSSSSASPVVSLEADKSYHLSSSLSDAAISSVFSRILISQHGSLTVAVHRSS